MRTLKVGQAGIDVGDSVLWPSVGRGILIVRVVAVEDGHRTFETRELHDGSRNWLTDLDSLTEDFVVVKHERR